MSTLPLSPLPTRTITVAGAEVSIRSLSRLSAAELNKYRGRAAEAEPFIVACGADVSEDEARAWLGSVDPDVGGALVEAILVLSGLAEGADEAGPTTGSASDSESPSSEP